MAEKKLSGIQFDPKSTGEEVLKFMKSSFDASFDNVVKVQDLNEKMLNEMIQKGEAVQKDTMKMVQDFAAQAKQERDKYRQAVEDGFKRMQQMLGGK